MKRPKPIYSRLNRQYKRSGTNTKSAYPGSDSINRTLEFTGPRDEGSTNRVTIGADGLYRVLYRYLDNEYEKRTEHTTFTRKTNCPWRAKIVLLADGNYIEGCLRRR